MTVGRASLQTTSTDKALEVCELLSRAARGLSVSDVARTLHLRCRRASGAGVLKRRGYVRQDEDTSRYCLTLKMLDLSFRPLGGSELRLHAYPLIREYALRDRAPRVSGHCRPPATSATCGRAGPDEVAMRTVFGREMPAHCALYFDAPAGHRRLSCLKLTLPPDLTARRAAGAVRAGGACRTARSAWSAPVHRCAITPARRWRVSASSRTARTNGRSLTEDHRDAWDLAGRISMRLGYLPPTALEASA